jgi:hypothetical protein
METYKAVKTQYNDLQLRLLKLEILAEQKTRVWVEANYKDKKASKEMREADKNVYDMRRRVKEVAYKLVALEHKEFGTPINKLSREHGISPLTIKKLLKENGVAYLRPTLVQWLPISTAPKDGTRFLTSIGVGGCMPEIEIVLYNVENSEWRTYAYDPPNIEESWMTHWMPLPEPLALVEKKDG